MYVVRARRSVARARSPFGWPLLCRCTLGHCWPKPEVAGATEGCGPLSPAFSLHSFFHICLLMNYQGVASSSCPVLRVSPAGSVSYCLQGKQGLWECLSLAAWGQGDHWSAFVCGLAFYHTYYSSVLSAFDYVIDAEIALCLSLPPSPWTCRY